MKKKIFISLGILLILILSTIIYQIFFVNVYTPIGIDSYLKSSDEVKVVQNDDGILFDGKGTDKILIFYPGAKVEYKSYSRFMYKLAENGIDTYLLDLPLNYAFFGENMPNKVINKYNYKTIYVGGHSLGGVVASTYASKHIDSVSGVILLASYPRKEVNDSLNLISIYGDKDAILNIDNYNKNKKYWPTSSYEIILEGANHSFFGNYGLQKNDNEIELSSEELQDEVVHIIIDYLK